MSKNATAPFDGTLTQPFQEISQAIADPDTLAGDTLLVLPGVYASFGLPSTKHLAIQSTDGPLVTAIQPGSSIQTVSVQSSSGPSRLEGFTVWGKPGGRAARGGGNATMRHCILLGLGVSSVGFLAEFCGATTNPVLEHC